MQREHIHKMLKAVYDFVALVTYKLLTNFKHRFARTNKTK